MATFLHSEEKSVQQGSHLSEIVEKIKIIK